MEVLDFHSELESIFPPSTGPQDIDFERELLETAKTVIQDVSKKCDFDEVSDLLDIYSIEKLDRGEEAPMTLHDVTRKKKNSSSCTEKSCIIPLQDDIKELVSKIAKNEVHSSSSSPPPAPSPPVAFSHSLPQQPSSSSCGDETSIKIPSPHPSQPENKSAAKKRAQRSQITSLFSKLQYLIGLDDRYCDRATILNRVKEEVKRLTAKETYLANKKTLLWQNEVSLLKEIVFKLKGINENQENETVKVEPLPVRQTRNSKAVSSGRHRQKRAKLDFCGFEATDRGGGNFPPPTFSDSESDSNVDVVGSASQQSQLLDDEKRNCASTRLSSKNTLPTQEQSIPIMRKMQKADFVGFQSTIASQDTPLFSPFSSDSEPEMDISLKNQKPHLASKDQISKRKRSLDSVGVSAKATEIKNSNPIQDKSRFLSLEKNTYLKNPSFLMPPHKWLAPPIVSAEPAVPLKQCKPAHSKSVKSAVAKNKKNHLICKNSTFSIYLNSSNPKVPREKAKGSKRSIPQGAATPAEESSACFPASGMPPSSVSDALTSNNMETLAPYLRKTNKCAQCGFESPLLGVFKRHQLSHSNSHSDPPFRSVLPPSPVPKMSLPYTLFTGSKEIPPLRSSPTSASQPPIAVVRTDNPGSAQKCSADTLARKDNASGVRSNRGCKSLKFPAAGEQQSKDSSCNTPAQKKLNSQNRKTKRSVSCVNKKAKSLDIPVTLLGSDRSLKEKESNPSLDMFSEQTPYNPKNCNFIGFPKTNCAPGANFVGFPSPKSKSLSPLKSLLDTTRIGVSLGTSTGIALAKRQKRSLNL